MYEITQHLQDNDYLTIKVMHRAGGMSYISGNTEKKGVQVSFTKEKITNEHGYNCSHSVPMDNCNFRFLALEYKRKSQKKIDAVYEYIYQNQEEYLECWLKGEFNYIILDVARNFKD